MTDTYERLRGLVERLRATFSVPVILGDGIVTPKRRTIAAIEYRYVNPNGPEAATEIEALLDRIAKLEAEGDALREALKTIAGNPEPDPDIAPIYDPRWSAAQCRAIARAALEAKHV